MVNKKVSPQKTSPWDLEAFEQQVNGDRNWNLRSTHTKVTRVQDLVLGSLDTPPPSPVINTSNTWPFESSPCRMFGGTTTRVSDDGDGKNEQLFDTKFAERSVVKRCVSDTEEDEESSVEFESEDMLLDDTDDDSSEGDENEVLQEIGPVENTSSVQRRWTSVPVKDDRAESPTGKKNGVGTAASSMAALSKSASLQHTRSLSRSRSASPQRPGNDREKKNRFPRTKSNSGAQSRTNTKGADKKASPSKKNDKPKVAVGSEKTNKSEKSTRRKNDKPRSHSTPDDSVPTTSNAGGSRVRRGVSRAKSSDGMEGLGGATEHTWSRKGGKRSDDLSTTSFHTSTSHSRRTRSSSARRESRTPKHSVGDRRSKFSRAMSTTNVKRPEEYAHTEAKEDNRLSQMIGDKRKTPKSSSSSMSVSSRDEDLSIMDAKCDSKISQDRRKTARASASESVVSRESNNAKSQTTATEETTAASVVTDDTEQRSTSKQRPAMRRKRSVRLGRSGSARSESSSRQVKPSDSDTKATTVSNSSNHGRSSFSKRTRERRDLMVLLRERRTIQSADLMDKENRKLLHYIMYEHKMGISQQELHDRIRQEKGSS